MFVSGISAKQRTEVIEICGSYSSYLYPIMKVALMINKIHPTFENIGTLIILTKLQRDSRLEVVQDVFVSAEIMKEFKVAKNNRVDNLVKDKFDKLKSEIKV